VTETKSPKRSNDAVKYQVTKTASETHAAPKHDKRFKNFEAILFDLKA
jgi:hypothetical protein